MSQPPNHKNVEYHVTNVQCQASNEPPTTVKEWPHLRGSVLRDLTFNGVLTGLPVVSMSVSLYNDDIPRFSPYPLSGEHGRDYWCVAVSLEPYRDHSMWLVDNTTVIDVQTWHDNNDNCQRADVNDRRKDTTSRSDLKQTYILLLKRGTMFEALYRKRWPDRELPGTPCLRRSVKKNM